MKPTITVYNLGGLPTASLDDFQELQEDFKIHDPDKVNKLALLIVTRGFKYAFKAWKDPEGKLWIIDAHQRKKALQELRRRGMDVPPIPYEPIQAENKREAVEEIAAYNSEFAKRNPDTVLFEKYEISAEELEQFEIKMEIDTGSLSEGCDLNDNLSEELSTLDLEQEYTAAVDQVVTISSPGDIWQLGKHRLMCGDACNNDDIKRLMGNKRCDLIITDPPYNVDYEGKSEEQVQKKIANDSMSDSSFDKFLFKAFRNLFTVSKKGASIYVFHAHTEAVAFMSNFVSVGFKLSQCCVWVKNSMVLGRQDYHWKHEPILYGWKEGNAHNWYNDRCQQTVWCFDRPDKSELHPTMKPIALISYPLLNSSREGDIVVDTFSGSGSTLMACEQHNRICHAMEISPAFVDVTIARFIKAKGSEKVYCLRDGKRHHYNELTNDSR